MIFSINCYMFSYLPLLPCRFNVRLSAFFRLQKMNLLTNISKVKPQSLTNSIIVFGVYLNEVNCAIYSIHNFELHRFIFFTVAPTIFLCLFFLMLLSFSLSPLPQCVLMIILCVFFVVYCRSVNNASAFKMNHKYVCVCVHVCVQKNDRFGWGVCVFSPPSS